MPTTLVDSAQLFKWHVSFAHTVAASGHVQEGTNANMLVPNVQPSAIVKAGALITIVITSSTCCQKQGLQARPYI